MRRFESGRKRKAVGLIIVGLLPVFLFACASGTVLKWNQVDTAAMMKSAAGKDAFHVIRFETFGPVAEQAFGYFLYRDGIDVVTNGGAHIVSLGKRSLEGVIADYSTVMRSRQYSDGSFLLVREVLRGGAIVGYTAGDINIDLTIWDITSKGSESNVVLKPVFTDRRRQIDGGVHPDRTFSGD